MTTLGGPPGGPGRRSRTARLTLAAMLALPLVELVVAILVGRWIGAAPTVLALILASLAGIVVLRRAGARTLRSLSAAPVPGLRTAGPDLRAAGDSAWVLLGGLLLAVPGFLSAVAGLLLVLPLTRRLVAPLLGRGAGLLASRLLGVPLLGRVLGGQVVSGTVVDATVVDVQVVPPTSPGPARPAPQLGERPGQDPTPPQGPTPEDGAPRRP